jgi:hypothetical protein
MMEGLAVDTSGSDRDVSGCCVYGCKPSGFIKCGEFFDQVKIYSLLKDSAA